MKFYCPLTKICTMTADKMRMHLAGDLYKRLAMSTPSWQNSKEHQILLDLLRESDELERAEKKARTEGQQTAGQQSGATQGGANRNQRRGGQAHKNRGRVG